ncbi:MAG TPA: hypothetical protein VNT60_08365 [Deinococcales bacterium]|nr:hypothetical protein [Deinococcales bacterium]
MSFEDFIRRLREALDNLSGSFRPQPVPVPVREPARAGRSRTVRR